MPRKHIDHSGETYGKLTLLYRGEDYIYEKSGARYPRYYCSCSCGRHTEENPKLIRWDRINSGRATSCGCIWEKNITKARKQNDYNLSGEYGIGYDCNNNEFYFDIEDYEKIKEYCWRVDNRGYVEAVNINRDIVSTNNKIRIHRLIMDCPKNMTVDHISGIKYDNRKSNLRISTYSQNNMNIGKRQNNNSGTTGVYHHRDVDKWCAEIGVNNKHIYLGLFNTLEEAVRIRKEAEEKYFGEYSYDNSQKTKIEL